MTDVLGSSGLTPFAAKVHRRFPSLSPYLLRPVAPSPIAALLLLLYLYENVTSPGIPGLVAGFLVLIAGLALLRLPRVLVYAASTIAMILLIYHYVQVDARGAQDALSDRNDAVEIGVRALLTGENPWNHKSPLLLPITTGPSSLLFAVPSVYFTGRINALTVLMWCLFLAFLLMGDITNENNSFLTLCLLMLFPWMRFIHTWHWALDELYYAAILLPCLWLAFRWKRMFLAGCLCGFMVFSRLGYAFGVLAAGFWLLLNERTPRRHFVRLVGGAALYGVATIVLFSAIGGRDVAHANFLSNSVAIPLSTQANWLAGSISAVLRFLPAGLLGGSVVTVAILFLGCLGMRSTEHPFFHVALGLLLAHTVVFSPPYPNDYVLLFVLPGMYGIAFERSPTVYWGSDT